MALVNLWTLRCDSGCGATSEPAPTSDEAYRIADAAGWDWGERTIVTGKTVRGGETCPACLARMRLWAETAS